LPLVAADVYLPGFKSWWAFKIEISQWKAVGAQTPPKFGPLRGCISKFVPNSSKLVVWNCEDRTPSDTSEIGHAEGLGGVRMVRGPRLIESAQVGYDVFDGW